MGRGDGYGDDKEEHAHGEEHAHAHEAHDHGKVHISSEEVLEKAEKKYPGERQIFHHHIHTLFSQLDGVASPRDYIKRAKEFGMTGISCTDHGNLSAIPDMYFEAAEAGLRFIPGIEAYFNEYHPVWADLESKGVKLADIKADSPEIAERITRNRHLIILAKNKVGWRNMLHFTSDSWEKGFYYKPRIWMDVLRPKKEGLIVLSGCLNGPIAHELALAVKHRTDHGKAQKYLENAISWVKKLKDEFAEDFFFELQMPGPDIQEGYDVLSLSIQLAKQFNIKTVLTGDCLSGNASIFVKDKGFTPISDIKVGQQVMTHKGRFREVEVCGSREMREGERAYSLFGSDIYLTENHELFIARDGEAIKVAVKDIKHDDHLLITPIDLPKDGLKHILITDYLPGSRIDKSGKVIPLRSCRKKHRINNEIVVDSDFLWMVGLYIAEGCNDQGYKCAFNLGPHEQDKADRLQRYFESIGVSTSVVTRGPLSLSAEARNADSAIVVRVLNSAMSRLLRHLTGSLAKNKRLPPFWYLLSVHQLKTLMLGYIGGDGSFRDHTGDNESYSVVIEQASPMLSLDIMNAMAALDVSVSPIHRIRPFEFKRHKANGDLYVRRGISKTYGCRINRWGCYVLGLIDDPKNTVSPSMIDGCIPIKNSGIVIQPSKARPKMVFDIQVKEDHSFNMGIASSNCHYLKKEDWETQRVLMAVGQKMTIDDPNLFMADTCEGYLKSRAEFRQTFSEFGYDRYATINDIETAMDGTIEIAERCEPFSPDLSPKLPSIQEADHQLMAKCAAELVKRGLDKSEKRYLVDGVMVTHAEQVMIELERIREKGFSSYFLITKNICDFSRNNGWPVAPGRGSAPGSLVCYLLGITELDPLKWGLSFNRFLSPSRGGYMLKCVMD